MPLYEYRCPAGHVSTDWVWTWREKKVALRCETCGQWAEWIPSLPQRAGDERAGWDTRSFWEGSPLEGTDGLNPLQRKAYKSTTPFMDLGKRR